MARAYFHGRSALFVCWLLLEPAATRFMDEARAVARSRRPRHHTTRSHP